MCIIFIIMQICSGFCLIYHTQVESWGFRHVLSELWRGNHAPWRRVHTGIRCEAQKCDPPTGLYVWEASSHTKPRLQQHRLSLGVDGGAMVTGDKPNQEKDISNAINNLAAYKNTSSRFLMQFNYLYILLTIFIGPLFIFFVLNCVYCSMSWSWNLLFLVFRDMWQGI